MRNMVWKKVSICWWKKGAFSSFPRETKLAKAEKRKPDFFAKIDFDAFFTHLLNKLRVF